MSRRQFLRSGQIVTVPVAGVAVPLSNVSRLVKSVTVQALTGNTDFVSVGDSTAQLQIIEPRRSMVVWGDNLDHGTAALIDLAEIYVNALVNNEGVSYTYLEGE